MGDLATGGMARLSLALQSGAFGFERVVVLKQMLPQYEGEAEFMEMFVNEANIAARLDHPNFARIYGFEKAGDQVVISMEYLPGEDLSSLNRRARYFGRLHPIREALTVAATCCSALEAAHSLVGNDGRPLEVVHRDVTPSNILITYHGGVKLLDFGIAKARTKSRETTVGTFKGKLCYASPEQLNGGATDCRTDVFCLGVTVWELLVGRRLFGANNDAATIDQVHRAEIPPPSSLRPDVLPAVDRVVKRALERDPRRRYQTAGEMASALQDALEAYNGPATPDDLKAWLVSVVGIERGRLKLAIAQGVDIEQNLGRLNALLMTERKARQVKNQSRLRPRTAWSTDLGGGFTPPSRRSSSRQIASSTSPADNTVPAGTPITDHPSLEPGATGMSELNPLSTFHAFDSSGPMPPQQSTPRVPRRAITAVAVLLVGVALGGWILVSTQDETPPAATIEYGRITVRSSPSGAAVFVDREPTGALTPTTIGTAVLGRSVQIGVQKDGFREASKAIVVEPTSTVEFQLEVVEGSVFFSGAPNGARLYVNDLQVSTAEAIKLPVGRHVLRVEHDNQLLGERTIEVKPGLNDIQALGGS